MFTALHRALGAPAGPLTIHLISDAIEQQLPEATDLDWKTKLPAQADLASSDLIKDVAAFANSGGGQLIFGVEEANKRAAGRRDIETVVDEKYERTFRQLTATHIQPPVLGLEFTVLDDERGRVVVLDVPASTAAPHLVYRGRDRDQFGAPMRNNADTIWMTEPQLAAAFRERFRGQADAANALDDAFTRAFEIAPPHTEARFVGVVRRVLPVINPQGLDEHGHQLWRLNSMGAAAMLARDESWGRFGPQAARRGGLELTDRRPRRGFRSWIFPPQANDVHGTWVTLGADGSANLNAPLGGFFLASGRQQPGGTVLGVHVERLVAELAALAIQSAALFGPSTYAVKFAVEWEGALTVVPEDGLGQPKPEWATLIPEHRPITGTLELGHDAEASAFDQVDTLITDAVNALGIAQRSTHTSNEPIR